MTLFILQLTAIVVSFATGDKIIKKITDDAA